MLAVKFKVLPLQTGELLPAVGVAGVGLITTVVVPGALTPAPHWPPRAHLIETAAATARTVTCRAMGLAAYDPAGDTKRRGAEFAIDMALAVVGSR